jgi:hypothetical protein
MGELTRLRASGRARPVEADNRSLILFDNGDEVTGEAGEEGIRFPLVSGKPLEEPVAWYGPIVMNTAPPPVAERGGRDVSYGSWLPSEDNLCRQLDQARRGGADDVTERRTVDVAVHRAGSVELGVVEQVECLETQLEGFRFAEAGVFLQG